MATDDTLRQGVRSHLETWANKLECGGDVEKQIEFKKKFISRLRQSLIAEATEKANEQHYEVPTEFFQTVLGSRLKYSCCYWPEGVTTLDEAETASLQRYCELCQLQDGQEVMDLGCGWGSFGLFVCERFPSCQVTCISNSSTQREFIQAVAQKRGFSPRLEVITADANVFTTSRKFDRIVSIEMFEHMKNYEALFQRVSEWLKPSGLLFLQVFCHRQHPYAFDIKPGSDTEWMAKHFFTGGTMPSMDLFLHFQLRVIVHKVEMTNNNDGCKEKCHQNNQQQREISLSRDVRLVDFWVLNGQHYSKTLDAWLQKMDGSMEKVTEIFDRFYGPDAEQQKSNWRLFFIFCSEVFGFRKGNEWHISYQLFQKNIPSLM